VRIRVETSSGMPITRQIAAQIRAQCASRALKPGDRLRHEFNLIFKEENPFPILDRLQELELLSAIHPALQWQKEQKPAAKAALFDPIPADWNLPSVIDHMSLRQGIVYLVWFIPLGEETALAIANRFHLNNTLLNSIHSACLLWSEQNVLAELKPSEFFDRVESCSLIAGYALYLLAEPGPFKEKILAALTRWLTLIPDTDRRSDENVHHDP